VTDLLWQGLTISLMGMGLTFAALGLLILAMYLLERLTRDQTGPPVAAQTDLPAKAPVSALAQDSAEEVVAAIAIALAHVRSLDICHSGLGSTLEVGPGPWWRMGQTHQLSLSTSKNLHDGVVSHEFDL